MLYGLVIVYLLADQLQVFGTVVLYRTLLQFTQLIYGIDFERNADLIFQKPL